MDTAALKKRIRTQLDAGESNAAWRELSKAANSLLDWVEYERLGAFITKRAASLQPAARESERIALLGQFTTTWLSNALCFAAAADAVLVESHSGEYDAIVAELTSPQLKEFRPGTIVLLPWHGSLLRTDADPEALVEEHLALWRSAWELASRLGARIVQVGYDWVHPGPLGFHLDGRRDGHVGRIRRANERLREALPEGSYFVDLPLVTGEIGRRAAYDRRGYYWTKNPFSPEGTAWLGRHIWAGARALKTGGKKLAALDLDNTLWGGVVGELGPFDIALGDSPDGEAFRGFQKHLLGLRDRGVLLAVASKNNLEDAREPFEKNPNMVLKLDHLSDFEAHWEPKSLSLARVAERLRLGIDSFAFLDDSPAEREQIRAALPEVSVPELGEEPADYAFKLSSSLLFETAAISDADRERAEQYRAEQVREAAVRSFETYNDYLRSLELRGVAVPFQDADMLRIAQLVAKTNQFNLTTRRHDRTALDRMRSESGSVCLSLSLRDRFGDYGMIGLIIGVPRGRGELEIDTWLMSCRALSRTAEHFLFLEFLRRAGEAGYSTILGSFLPTKKNAQVATLLPTLGFELVKEEPDGARHYQLSVAKSLPVETLVIQEQPSV